MLNRIWHGICFIYVYRCRSFIYLAVLRKLARYLLIYSRVLFFWTIKFIFIMLEPISFVAPVLVEQISAYVVPDYLLGASVAPSLLSVAPFRPVIRGTGDTRHLLAIATFARECCPSQMVVGDYDVTFYGHDRHRMPILLFRYLVSAGLARVVGHVSDSRPFSNPIRAREGAFMYALVGKSYLFIGK